MDDPSEREPELPGEQNPNNGFSFLDMLDLTPEMHIIMHLLIPTMALSYVRLCEATEKLPEAERLSRREIDETLKQLIERGFIASSMSEGQPVYTVILGRRKARTTSLDKDIWDSLGWDDKP